MPLPAALVSTLVLAVVAWRVRAVTVEGALVGSALALAHATAPTPAPFVLFAAFVFIGTGVSRLGRAAKKARGVAQADGGRRGPLHALANCGAGALALVSATSLGTPDPESAQLFAVGALAAMLSDTVSSEIGAWLGGSPVHLRRLRRVEVGADGAVSRVGSLAGLIASVLAGGLAAFWGGSPVFAAAAAAGIAGNAVDSILGASIEPRLGRAGNSVVNLLASASGGGVALLLA